MSKQARARVRTQELRKAQHEAAQRQLRRRRIVTTVGGAVILALVIAIVVALVDAAGGGDGGGDGPGTSGDVVAPGNLTADGAIPVGRADAPVTVDLYYDYMCPACGAFEAANAEELDGLVEEGTARIDLRPMSFLDETSNGTQYSTRAANAVATVADGAPDKVWDFHRALYEAQPEEGTSGVSDEQIAGIAEDAGVPAEVVDRFRDRTYDEWVAAVTEDAFDAGVESTPTVLVDGERFTGDLFTPGPLAEAVESAAGR